MTFLSRGIDSTRHLSSPRIELNGASCAPRSRPERPFQRTSELRDFLFAFRPCFLPFSYASAQCMHPPAHLRAVVRAARTKIVSGAQHTRPARVRTNARARQWHRHLHHHRAGRCVRRLEAAPRREGRGQAAAISVLFATRRNNLANKHFYSASTSPISASCTKRVQFAPCRKLFFVS